MDMRGLAILDLDKKSSKKVQKKFKKSSKKVQKKFNCACRIRHAHTLLTSPPGAPKLKEIRIINN